MDNNRDAQDYQYYYGHHDAQSDEEFTNDDHDMDGDNCDEPSPSPELSSKSIASLATPIEPPDINAASTFSTESACSDTFLKLKSEGVSCFNSTWKQNLATAHVHNSIHFNLILKEPQESPSMSFVHSLPSVSNMQVALDKKEISKFPEFMNKVLKPAGHAIIVILFCKFSKSYD